MNPAAQQEAEANPSRALRVLHLEDDLNDRAIVQAMLAASRPCEFTYAANEAEFRVALEQDVFDLILSDFTLPAYDGASALALAQAQQPETPYLFVSGTIGEERAIESLKSGATDYVLKDRLERLGPAVERALREAGERAKRRQAEEALRQAEARLRSIFENAVEGIFQASPEGRYLMVNAALAGIYGYASPAEVLTELDAIAGSHHGDAARRSEFKHRLTERGEVRNFESKIRRKDGREIWISENARAIRDAAGRLLRYEGTVEDITFRKIADEALLRSEERFREMAENIHDVFWITSADGRDLHYVSPAYEQIWGRTLQELHAQPSLWIEAIVPSDQARVLAVLAGLVTGREYRVEYRILRPDGSQRWVEDRGYPVRGASGQIERAVGVVTDITDRKQLEAQLQQSQKMEAVGQLAGGIAHDFNNILTVIVGQAGLLLETNAFSPDHMEALKQIYSAGERAAGLTRQLLVFSRKQAINRRALDLNETIDEVSKMLRRLIGEHIRLELTLFSHLPPIEADASMMEQILLNLAVNARDAMPRGGHLIVETEAVTITEAELKRHPEGRLGSFVCLSVGDTGSGINPEVLPHIFEPFFTTKEAGKGTGLGLATVFGIVKQHHGWITVESEVGEGTAFKVFLPVAPPEAVTATRRQAEAKINSGGETILLVEDEPRVREFAMAVLQKYGYRVLQAGSGVEALEVWKWHSPRIDLLLTDMVMPDQMTGRELAERLQAEKPQLQVICTSGYSSEMMEQVFDPQTAMYFIHKPYQPRALAKVVREALDRKTQGAR